MNKLLKDLNIIISFSKAIKLLSIIRVLMTVVIIAFSVITGAKMIMPPKTTE